MNEFYNNIITTFFLDYSDNRTLLDTIYDANIYTPIFFVEIVFHLAAVFLFYKLINPITKQRLKWLLLLVINCIIAFIISKSMLQSNGSVIDELVNMGDDETGYLTPNIPSVISFLNVLFSLVFTLILSIGLKYSSKTNRNNPF